jgi:hypothetical protein
VEMLLEYGSRNMQNHEGETADEVALRNGPEELAEFFSGR